MHNRGTFGIVGSGMFFMPEPVQRCQSTSRNLRAVSSNSGNHPLALSFLDLPTGSWVKRCCTLYTGLPVSVQSDCEKVLSVSFHRICVTSYTGWTFLSGCSTNCVQWSIDVCSTKHHSTWRTAASTPQTLLIDSICGPKAAISCLHHNTGVWCLVVRFLSRDAMHPRY